MVRPTGVSPAATRFFPMACAALAAVAAATAPAAAQNTDVRVQQALDRPVNLEIPDAPVTEVMDQLSAMTGVKFVLDDRVAERLPYGLQSRMSVTLRDVTLRKALTPMLAPQALQWRVEQDTVRIVPAPALARMTRRATYEELQLLGTLYSAELSTTEEPDGALEQMRRLAEKDNLKLSLEPEAERSEVLRKANAELPATGAEWLEAMCEPHDWTWHVSGDRIVVIEQTEQVRRQLARQVSLRYQEAELVAVLLELAQKADVHLSIDPDTFNYVPAETRESFNLIMSDATISQALEVIAGVTGLAFETTSDGLQVSASEELKQRVQESTPRREGPRFLVRLSVPGPEGVTVDVFMRADDLPEEVFENLDKLRMEALERLKEQASQ
ncbi:MAG: hypothetical protein ACP5HU_02135 [Phycisphaerae bacterium]